MLIEYKEIIDKELRLFGDKLPSLSIYEPIKYIINNGGKRFRSSLTLMATDLFSNQPRLVINEAIAIELFHNFTLIHDDIMDQAPIRRNLPAVHEKWDENIAILSGDLLHALVNQLLSKSSSQTPTLHQIFQQTAIEVCEGQSLDMEFEKLEIISISDYINMIQLKTSVLVACSLKMGALVGGASNKDAQLLYDFGFNLGTSFQIHDDILDVFPNENNFGKQVGGDIIEKKKTILFTDFLSKASKEDKDTVNHIIDNKQFINDQKVSKVKEFYLKYDVLKVAQELKNNFYDKSIISLENLSLSDGKKKIIEDFSVQLMNRKY
ncbi:polyprenyl synthetase family protein [Flavobacteriales bacterium]|nr:polyprenyl synthetase family protein [Flavobacteriales bacterium]